MLRFVVWMLGMLVTVVAIPLSAAEWYVGPNGKADGKGTQDSPWDIASALGGQQKIAPGDTLWILGGTYKHPNRQLGSAGYELRLAGQEGKPIHIRAASGERVTLDGGLTVQPPSTFVWVRDLEIVNVSMQLGYSAPHNEDCEVRGNVIVNGGLSINKFKKVTNQGNTVLGRREGQATDAPQSAIVHVRPSRYDTTRAHVAVFNWKREPTIELTLADFLKPGDEYRLMNPRDFFGKPVATGRFDGKSIRLPMADSFAAMVLLKR